MPNSVTCVIFPYGRFVEYRDRRREKAVQPIEPDNSRAIDGGVMSAGPRAGSSERRNGKVILNIRVGIPRVHMTGSNAHYNAYLEVGQHGFALFLGPDAAAPVLDIDGTLEQLDAVVDGLQAALVARRMADATTETDAVQMELPDSELGPASQA
jgi:hypothetical protein